MLQGVIGGMTCYVTGNEVCVEVWSTCGGSERSRIGSGVSIQWRFHCNLDSKEYQSSGFDGDVC